MPLDKASLWEGGHSSYTSISAESQSEWHRKIYCQLLVWLIFIREYFLFRYFALLIMWLNYREIPNDHHDLKAILHLLKWNLLHRGSSQSPFTTYTFGRCRKPPTCRYTDIQSEKYHDLPAGSALCLIILYNPHAQVPWNAGEGFDLELCLCWWDLYLRRHRKHCFPIKPFLFLLLADRNKPSGTQTREI